MAYIWTYLERYNHMVHTQMQMDSQTITHAHAIHLERGSHLDIPGKRQSGSHLDTPVGGQSDGSNSDTHSGGQSNGPHSNTPARTARCITLKGQSDTAQYYHILDRCRASSGASLSE